MKRRLPTHLRKQLTLFDEEIKAGLRGKILGYSVSKLYASFRKQGFEFILDDRIREIEQEMFSDKKIDGV